MNFKALKYIYNSTGNPDARTLLLLHGTGGNETDLIPLAENFGKGFNILSVRGNIEENGMPRFFSRLGMGIFDEKDLEFRTHELVHFLKSIAESEGFDITKIIALGYSNGANIAGSILVLYPNLLSGAILFRPMLPYTNMPEFKSDIATNVFLSSGRLDRTVKLEDIGKYVGLLKKNNFNVESHILEASHGLTKEDLLYALKWTAMNYEGRYAL